MPNAECTDCQEQSLFHSKEGKGRGEASCARPSGVGNRNRVQLVTALSAADFFPGYSSSVKSVYLFHLLSALTAFKETLVTLFPPRFIVSLTR